MTSSFAEFCQEISPLDQRSIDRLKVFFRDAEVSKGEPILRAGQYCRHLYFLERGLVKLRVNNDGREFVMRFFNDGMLFTIPDSLLRHSPSDYDLIALEDVRFTMISYDDMENVCGELHEVERFFRKFLGIACTNMMHRINEMLTENAAERYSLFLKQHPSLIQRLTLGDIAAYLGITQVSLSRIRSQF